MSGTGGASTDPGAGPYQPETPNPAIPLSPVELVYQLVKRDVEPSICPWVVVGPAEHAMQQEGVCSLTQAGNSQSNPHVPLIWQRIQIRCIAHTMAHAEQIGQHVYQLLHTRHREAVVQPSSGLAYLVHHTQCISGPSNHYDGPATWESLAFYEALVHTTPMTSVAPASGPLGPQV